MPEDSASKPLTRVEWLICIVASLGFAFDIYELLMLPLVLPGALRELAGVQLGSPEFAHWRDLMFYVPAVAGGVFGLIGGYLTDLWGRRRVLVGSILLYAFSALAAGYATSMEMLLFLRCTTFIGVCVEFVAAVAWLAELFPDPKRREKVLGYTQAFSSLGGLMVSAVYTLLSRWSPELPAIHGSHEPWRYLLISGVIPAIPLIVIRPFLPESPEWARKKAAGTLKRPSILAVFAPEYRRVTLVTTLMFACAYGAAFGAIQQLPQLVPALPEVRTMAREAAEAAGARAASPAAAEGGEAAGQPDPAVARAAEAGRRVAVQQTVGTVQMIQELGGLAGRFALAYLAVIVISRRNLLRTFQVPGMVILPLVFVFPATDDLTLLKAGIFLVGFCTVAQFSFWGNYLPRVYPVHLRGTGESVAANIGGRMLGTSAALLTTQFTHLVPGDTPAVKLAYASAAVGFLVYVLGFALSFLLPEPKEEMPE
jgi:MFS family permease